MRVDLLGCGHPELNIQVQDNTIRLIGCLLGSALRLYPGKSVRTSLRGVDTPRREASPCSGQRRWTAAAVRDLAWLRRGAACSAVALPRSRNSADYQWRRFRRIARMAVPQCQKYQEVVYANPGLCAAREPDTDQRGAAVLPSGRTFGLDSGYFLFNGRRGDLYQDPVFPCFTLSVGSERLQDP